MGFCPQDDVHRITGSKDRRKFTEEEAMLTEYTQPKKLCLQYNSQNGEHSELGKSYEQGFSHG